MRIQYSFTNLDCVVSNENGETIGSVSAKEVAVDLDIMKLLASGMSLQEMMNKIAGQALQSGKSKTENKVVS